MKRLPVMLVLTALMLIGNGGMRAQETKRKFVPVTDAMLQNPDPANWMMWRRTLDSWGYSPLNQVNRNTGNCAWSGRAVSVQAVRRRRRRWFTTA